MKKKIIILIIITVLIISLFPIKNKLKDGGTVEYKALLYKISNVHSIISLEEMESKDKIKPYNDGIIVQILGFEIYNNVK